MTAVEPQDESPRDVAIVGLGPVGATLANLLGMCGLSVVVIEREKNIHKLPRAVHFDDEVLRVFQTIGVADEVVVNSPFNPGMRFVNNHGHLLLDWPRSPDIGEQLWQTSFHFHQPDLELVLRNALKRFPNVSVITQRQVVAITTLNDGVELTTQHISADNPDTTTIRAKYVVGCDGARSVVRQSMKAEVLDLGFRERWLVVDVLLNENKAELGDYTIQYCDADRPATYVRGPLNRRRWEIAVHDSEDSEKISSGESVWKLLSRWLKPSEATIERVAVYTFHSLLSKQWCGDRLLLAGDSAHQMPPFMGQGMCAGIRDAANLAWKLKACIDGHSSDRLLDTYQAERYPHVRHYIETAIQLGNLINACDSKQALQHVFNQGVGSAKMKTTTPPLGQCMVDNIHAGLLAPQVLLTNQRKIDDEAGYCSVLLLAADLPVDIPQRELLIGSGIFVITSEKQSGVQKLLTRYKSNAIFIRPDRYILGTANTTDELIELIDIAHANGLLALHGKSVA